MSAMDDDATFSTEPARMSREELDQLARRIITNEVFITNTEQGYKNSFGVLLIFGAVSPDFAVKVGAMWEELSKAGPRSINGFPMFTSARFVHIDDLEELIALVAAKQEALNAT